MRILFLLGATSRIRNFHEALRILADNGHEIRLTGKMRKGTFELPPSVGHPRISGAVNPTQRTDAWRDFVDLLRGARDYVRYFDPRYGQATRLVRRAYEIAPTEFVLFCERHPWVKRNWKAVARALAFCEELIPVDPGFESFLREERPDLILVTPLVTFESYQTDYVKAAQKLGIPVVFIPFSWDNLTNKGLMRIQPDRVFVWNDVQRTEAVDLHGCPPAHIVITGAARFDEFFDRTPSMTRARFLAEQGLDPERPMVLYLGSSQLTGPNEMELIRRWVESLRAAGPDNVRTANILIRPHPALRASWMSVDLSAFPNVAVSLNASRNADQELFDSLCHAHAAVGLNTSAMLEAAIVGRPVHTLVIPGFDEGQVGTMHFHYLVEAYGGLATIARDFEEHHRQLSTVLHGEPACLERSRSFAAHFLRPHGIGRPVSPILASEIERAASLTRRPSVTPAWQRPLRSALLRWLEGRRVKHRTAVDSTMIGTSISLRVVRTALEELQQGTAPVFVGPWNDSTANELLYWIPFVRWASATYGIAAERLIVISNGGARAWYGSLAQRFLDARTLFAPTEMERWASRTVPQREQDYKQSVMSPFDAEIVERAARAFDLTDYQVLHPSMLFRVVSRHEKDRALARLEEVLQRTRLEASSAGPAPLVPQGIVAVSVAFTETLPKTEENARFLSQFLEDAAAAHDVLLLDCPPPPEVAIPSSPRVHRLQDWFAQEPTALAQTRALAAADAFIGSHGDLGVLASFCGTPTVTYQSDRLPVDQVERLHAAEAAGWGRVTVERAHRYKGVRLPRRVRV